MPRVKLQWATPDADAQIMYMARVSNPKNQDSGKARLLYYCMENGHVSPFEMASACLEIEGSRSITRQILRHRASSFQEFSQRYQDVNELPEFEVVECRLQDTKNRQKSIKLDDSDESKQLSYLWEQHQRDVIHKSLSIYNWAINNGIAKEQARVVLPEGLTQTRLYMSSNFRNWIFYLKQRLDPTAQEEHRLIAVECLKVLRTVAPITMKAFFGDENENT